MRNSWRETPKLLCPNISHFVAATLRFERKTNRILIFRLIAHFFQKSVVNAFFRPLPREYFRDRRCSRCLIIGEAQFQKSGKLPDNCRIFVVIVIESRQKRFTARTWTISSGEQQLTAPPPPPPAIAKNFGTKFCDTSSFSAPSVTKTSKSEKSSRPKFFQPA